MPTPLAELMRQKGWSASRLARATGLSRGALYFILRGINGVRLSTAQRIASVLGVSVEDIEFPAVPSMPRPGSHPNGSDVDGGQQEVTGS